jgi:hypothetical protein
MQLYDGLQPQVAHALSGASSQKVGIPSMQA